MEFGSRRAQGADAAILGARAAYIGGCNGTACTISDQLFGVYAGGTMAHAWVQMFDTEYEAFKAYCKMYPNNATLLVDTYNTLKSGVPNAIRAFNEVLKPLGITKCGIRLDSGDMAYLTQKARKMLDDAGWTECKISVSNSLDEYIIQDLHFSQEDIEYLRGRKLFSEEFLAYLADFKFTGDIWAVPEGTPMFPNEPIITVRAPAIEAHLIETYLLLCINHQSLIATKANRVVRAAEGRTVLEFGSRRAQGADAAILGARAA